MGYMVYNKGRRKFLAKDGDVDVAILPETTYEFRSVKSGKELVKRYPDELNAGPVNSPSKEVKKKLKEKDDEIKRLKEQLAKQGGAIDAPKDGAEKKEVPAVGGDAEKEEGK